MNAWTRRLTMPLAVAVLTAGCATTTALPPGAKSTSQPAAVMPSTPPPSPSPTPPPAPQPTPQPTTPPTVAKIAQLQGLVAADPADADAERDLGFALLQRVRETADPSLYAPAGEAFEAARKLAPDDALVLAGIGEIGRASCRERV